MSYKVELNFEENFLHFTISGKRIPGKQTADTVEFWKNVVEQSKKYDKQKLLVVSNLTGPFDVVHMYVVFKNVNYIGWNSSLKLAIVYSEEDYTLLKQYLDSNNNSGFHFNVQAFSDKEVALTWLLMD